MDLQMGNIAKNVPNLCISVVLRKAFDTVSHIQLFEVMKVIGFRRVTLALLKSYLHFRIQCVNIDTIMSDFRYVAYGVPQGTFLGPIPYKIYLKNIFQLETMGNIVSFADDTSTT